MRDSAVRGVPGRTLARDPLRRHVSRSADRDGLLRAVVCAYAASLPTELFSLPIGVSLSTVTGALVLIVWTIVQLRDGGFRQFRLGTAGLAATTYWLWALLMSAGATDPGLAVKWVYSTGALVITTIALASVIGSFWRQAVAWFAGVATIVAAALLASPLDPTRGDRAALAGADENATAFILVVAFAADIYFVLHLSGWRRLGWVTAGIIAGAATLHSGSRSGALGLIAVMLTVVLTTFLSARRAPNRRSIAVPLILLVGLVATYEVLVAASLVPQRVFSVFSDVSTGADAGRSAIWAEYSTHMSDWILTGVGPGNDATYLALTTGEFRNVHNLLGRAWVELGLIGMLLLLALLVATTARGIRSPARAFLALALGPLAIFAWTLGGDTSNVLWFVAALAWMLPAECARPDPAAPGVHTRRLEAPYDSAGDPPSGAHSRTGRIR